MLPHEIKELYQKRASIFRAVLDNTPPPNVERGQLWSTNGALHLSNGQRFETEEPRILLVLERVDTPAADHLEQFLALPLSIDVAMASEFDLVVPVEASSLGFAFMIEAWNEVPLLKPHLKTYLGALTTEYYQAVKQLHTAYALERNVISPLVGHVGPTLMDEKDVRFAFQAREIQSVTYLAQAARAYIGSLEPAPSPASMIATMQPALLPNIQPSWERLLKRLEGIGLPRTFVMARLVPPELQSSAQKKARRTAKEEHTLVSSVAELVQRIFQLDESTLFSTTAVPLHVAYGTPRFKKPKTANAQRSSAYTLYAHYLALLVFQATPTLKPQSLPDRAPVFYEAVVGEFGQVSFETVLRYAWGRGVAVLPLNDPGNFHGACWREEYRNIIVIKQRSDYEAYWLFNLLHELKHAANEPDTPELSTVELEPDQAWLLEEEEQEANHFAGSIMLQGRAERLVKRCVTEAHNEERNLKAAVQRVARSENIREDALANYLAYRLAMEGRDWWATAASLQVPNSNLFALARDTLLTQLDVTLLNEADRGLLYRALELEE